MDFYSKLILKTGIGFSLIILTQSCESKKKDVKPSPSNQDAKVTPVDPNATQCPTPTQLRLQNTPQEDSPSDDSWSNPPETQAQDSGPEVPAPGDNWQDNTQKSDCPTTSAPTPEEGSQSPNGPTAPEASSTSKGTSTGTGVTSTGGGPTTPQQPGPSGPSGNPFYSTGPGIQGCESQGKVWRAVDSTQPGKSGSCGEALTSFCCTQSEILKQFSSAKAFLEPELSKASSQGLTLYGCSSDGSTKTTFHFANFDGISWSYRSLYITAKSNIGTPPASCPKVTEADLGFK